MSSDDNVVGHNLGWKTEEGVTCQAWVSGGLGVDLLNIPFRLTPESLGPTPTWLTSGPRMTPKERGTSFVDSKEQALQVQLCYPATQPCDFGSLSCTENSFPGSRMLSQ